MSLPESKKERIQTIVLIILGIIFVVYVSVNYAIKPSLKKRSEQLSRIEELKSKIKSVESVISLVKSGKKVNRDVVNNIVQITETSNYVMKARLGNYLIGATEIIEAIAKEEGIPLESVRELHITDIPDKNKGSNPFQLYTIKISTICGMHSLISFLKNIEASNPYLSISEIEITGRKKEPGTHFISFNIEWPTWQNEETIASIIQSCETP